MTKKIISGVLTTCLVAVLPMQSFAAENVVKINDQEMIIFEGQEFYVDQNGYIEMRNTIDTSSLEIVDTEDGLQINALDNASETLEEKEVLETLLSEYEDLDEFICSEVASLEDESSLYAISYTVAPLVFEEDHYERITVKELEDTPALLSTSSSGSTSQKGYFALVTSVSRSDSAMTAGNYVGQYRYTCTTKGTWSKNSVAGGSDYPAAGNDYIWQTQPTSLTRNTDSFSMTFNTSRTATNGGTQYVQYSLSDDPTGTAQMTGCTLKTICYGKSGVTRMINSYYRHTWKSMSVSSVGISTSNTKETSLSITMSLQESYWPLYSYVTITF